MREIHRFATRPCLPRARPRRPARGADLLGRHAALREHRAGPAGVPARGRAGRSTRSASTRGAPTARSSTRTATCWARSTATATTAWTDMMRRGEGAHRRGAHLRDHRHPLPAVQRQQPAPLVRDEPAASCCRPGVRFLPDLRSLFYYYLGGVHDGGLHLGQRHAAHGRREAQVEPGDSHGSSGSRRGSCPRSWRPATVVGALPKPLAESSGLTGRS